MSTKKRFTVSELIKQASRGYPDDYIYHVCWDRKANCPVTGAGDGLAEYVAIELFETFDADADRDTQLQTAIHVLNTSRQELQDCVNALEELRDDSRVNIDH